MANFLDKSGLGVILDSISTYVQKLFLNLLSRSEELNADYDILDSKINDCYALLPDVEKKINSFNKWSNAAKNAFEMKITDDVNERYRAIRDFNYARSLSFDNVDNTLLLDNLLDAGYIGVNALVFENRGSAVYLLFPFGEQKNKMFIQIVTGAVPLECGIKGDTVGDMCVVNSFRIVANGTCGDWM